jgi:predicted nucleic acid-binding protein
MEPAVLGLVLDSSVLIAAERAKLTTPEAIKSIRASVGEIPVAICALTIAELAHGIYRARTADRSRQRRQFLDELKAQVPIHPVAEGTAEIIARIGAEQAARGINLPLADLIIGASAVELGYAVATKNLRDFNRIPGLRVVQL